MPVSYRNIVSLALVVLVSGACGDSTSKSGIDQRLTEHELAKKQKGHLHKAGEFHFGFDLRASPQEDARQYLPFLDYLERTTGYHFKLTFTPSDEDIATSLGTGKVQFAAIGAVSFIEAQRRYGAIALAHGINALGKSEYRSFFVVRRNSPVKSVAQLKGRQLAFGSASSTQGHLIPRIVLHRHGLALSDLAGYTYTGSHQSCADAVVAQRADACGMQDTLAERLAKQGSIRILHRSDYYPSSGIAANRDVQIEVIDSIRTALMDFEPEGRDALGLYAWQRTEMPQGFSAAKSLDYERLKNWMQKLGLSEKE